MQQIYIIFLYKRTKFVRLLTFFLTEKSLPIVYQIVTKYECL